jgi:hypothetical protein
MPIGYARDAAIYFVTLAFADGRACSKRAAAIKLEAKRANQ